MVVCHCVAVNDRRIAELVGGGDTTVADIIDSCGAGGDCGLCHEAIETTLAAHADADRSVTVGGR